jgi:hypothetical protein
MTRWDEESKQAVPLSRSERNALRYARQQPTGAAAQVEHYQDQESLQSYVRAEVAPTVSSLLTRRNVTWEHLHFLLSKAHLSLEKGKLGGYTVLAIDHNIRVKASDVFRNNFAGKVNRQTTETTLGPWRPSSISPEQIAQHTVRTPVRNSLGYHLKSGHTLSVQNRPTGLARDVIVLPFRRVHLQGAVSDVDVAPDFQRFWLRVMVVVAPPGSRLAE